MLPFSASLWRLQTPLRYISFSGLDDYHCHHLYVWNDKTRTRWRGKTCSDSVQSCAASLYPFLFIRISAVSEFSPFSVIQARYLNGFMGKNLSLRISYSLSLSSNISRFIRLESLFRWPQGPA